MICPVVRLKPKEDFRVLKGHAWVFSNEISKIEGEPSTGDVVDVRNAKNSQIGFGFYNSKSLIAVRIISSDQTPWGKEFVEPGKQFFIDRLQSASSFRQKIFESPFYRLAYGESDFLPGLIVDRFGDLFSVQILSAGIERRKNLVYDSIKELFSPLAIYERNDTPTRELEGLVQSRSVILGKEQTVEYEEAGVLFRINPFAGQKTGFYFDQRSNRIFARRFASGAEVLDLYSNEGGFALGMAHAGATEVTAIDSSSAAIEALMTNSRLNHLADVKADVSDAEEFLRRAIAAGKQFDVVASDPPSFTRNKKGVPSAKAGYRQLHKSIFSLLKPGGTLLTSSCSHHIFRETFEEIISEAAHKCGRALQLLHRAGAAPDHPVIPGMPETEYLKFNAYRVL
jgi:23S rRNA (cytosine1962-C5)-methyltransferase